ncbi:Dihydrolipoyl dehydrogenase [Candidatus Bealeia paramacronuclearis]|uniref:Dihydrolipoyl dehydrogenase n=1 Tax=Candidatus Bealeia paramacronuclearis TaxID=1921001 RepID=A0ABZ2C647_9PROT|nr:Dihydrolipoyl dehydrogenase [Candidatus Bealeia paramacronuclearis]
MAQHQADLVIVGGGPGGYVAAIKAAQLGLQVICVEKREGLGGTCLNVGCIPSKALLESSHKFEEVQHGLSAHGINVGKIELDLKELLARKTKVVEDLVKGIDFLFKKNKVTRILGEGRIVSSTQVAVKLNNGGEDVIDTKRIVIATGSESAVMPGIEIDEEIIVTSTGALSLKKVPKTMVVVGGGYIGLEMGSVWRRLGSEVTIIEYMDRIVPTMDHEVGNALMKTLAKQGLKFKLSTKVLEIKAKKDHAVLKISPAQGGAEEEIKTDVVLIATGRKPYIKGLGVEALGLQMNERGTIAVNAHYETSVPGIYAIGDVIPGPMLAHKAEEEGVAVAEHIAGKVGHVNYGVIPAVIFTSPEVATVGATEEELKAQGIAYRVGKFPFVANSRAKAIGETEGFVKILADQNFDRILGCHIIGPDAGTMIAEIAVAMEFGGSAEDVARTCHAHPTLSEAVKEAALAVEIGAIHM